MLKGEASLGSLERQWKEACAKIYDYSAYFEHGSKVKELRDNPSCILGVQNAMEDLKIK